MNVTREMVDRFLCWKLPYDFHPDGYISFSPGHATPESHYWPVGTNLLTSTQAAAMLDHVLHIDADGISPGWCATYPETAAAIINDLARRLDGMTPNMN